MVAIGLVTDLQKTIDGINTAGSTIEHKSTYDITLHTDAYDLVIEKYTTVDVVGDFVESNTYNITLDCFIPLGDFVKHVYPKRDNLRVTLVHRVIGFMTVIRYKCVIKELPDDIHRGIYNRTHIDELNSKDMPRITFQLLSETGEELRTKRVYGIHSGKDVGTVIATHLQEQLNRTTFSMEVESKGVVMHKPTNQRTYNHIVIESGEEVLNLPRYLQDGDYGVYNGDIGTFLTSNGKEEKIHVYPLYKPDKEDTTKRVLNVYATIGRLSPKNNNTYTVDGDEAINIVVELGDRPFDVGNSKHISNGIGFEGVESDTVMRRSHQTSPDSVKSSKLWTMRKGIHKEMPDKEYNTRYIGTTNNWYKVRSSVLANDGKTVIVNWPKSNVRFLTPGMYVNFYMEDHLGDLCKYEGTLHGVHAMTKKDSDLETALLAIFIVNDDIREVI